MGSLDPSITNRTTISELTLPGTHNAGTFSESMYLPRHIAHGVGTVPVIGAIVSYFGTKIARCQSLPIAQQLRIGVRCLDLRVGFNDNGEAHVCHTMVCSTSLNEVITEVYQFLADHPTEIVVLMVKWDWECRQQATPAKWKTVFGVLNNNRTANVSDKSPDRATKSHHLFF